MNRLDVHDITKSQRIILDTDICQRLGGLFTTPELKTLLSEKGYNNGAFPKGIKSLVYKSGFGMGNSALISTASLSILRRIIKMNENISETLYCSHCGAIIGEEEIYDTIDGEIVCNDCVERHELFSFCYRNIEIIE